MRIPRPFPPKLLIDSFNPGFYPDGDLNVFVERMFLDEDSQFYNEHHAHLLGAKIGFLWTNVAYESKMKQIAATAQIPMIQGNRWNKGIFDYQLISWFGDYPIDFLITIDANYAELMDDDSFCAVLEHEMYHCSYKGVKMDGSPKWAIRDHDVTEFVGITARYGAHVSLNVPQLVEAANSKPLFSPEQITAVCGNCQRVAAW